MTEIQLAQIKGLNIGDRLVRHKGGIFTKHHGIYVGVHNGQALVAENQAGRGVQYVTLADFLLGRAENLVRIERFPGTEAQRRQVIPVINSLLGKEYDMVNFNCEHFAELIQYGKPRSRQVENAGAVLAGVGLFMLAGALFGGNK